MTTEKSNTCPPVEYVAMSADDFIAHDSSTEMQYIKIADFSVSNETLRNIEYNYSKFTNITFNGINFYSSDFKYVEFENVVFNNCNMERCSFDFSSMKNVVFNKCMLNYSSFDYAAGNAELNMCSLDGVEFHHISLNAKMVSCSGECIEINFCNDMTIYAENCDFHRGEFLDSNYHGKMINSTFSNADFSGSDGSDLTFEKCTLRDISKNSSVGIAEKKNDDDFYIDLDESLKKDLDELFADNNSFDDDDMNI